MGRSLTGGFMAKKKVYAVRKGKVTGLFDNWPDCQKSVTGYPGAEFKGFTDLEEAKVYLKRGEGDSDIPGKVKQKESGKEEPSDLENCLVAYVDGSFDEHIGRYSFGCILLTPKGETVQRSGNGENPESLAIRNVAGEMLGAMYAVRWAVKNGYRELVIRYDYQGIEKWAVGDWQAKNPLTQKYAQFMRQSMEAVTIHFQKVKAHSGNYYNEQVDQLAKDALTNGNGIPPV